MPRRGRHHRRLLLDGHNILHQHPEFRRFMLDEPERGRRALEQALQGTARCHLFYDGGPGGAASRTHRRGLDIHYSGAGSADDAIVAALRAGGGSGCDVVTDDRELAGRARAHGARVLAVGGFIRNVHAGDANGEGADDPQRGPPPPGEVDHWLRAFGVDEPEG
ncbi:MAG: NYN domain-containing protein [Planctomycetota bacterium]|nr:NYN domain-containing protein [Planctomycetota bacterium]